MARRKIGQLEIDVRANTAKISRDVSVIRGNVRRGMKSVSSAGSTAKKVFVGMFAGAVIKRAAQYAKVVIDAADETAKMSKRVGIAVDELSGLNYAARLSNVGINEMNTGLRRLARNMEMASKGTGDSFDMFSKLGISVKDSNGNLRNTEDVLDDLADSFEGMANGAQKSAAASILLGRTGTSLIPMLNDGSKGLRAMKEEAKALGITISKEFARDAEQMNDNLNKITGVLDGQVRAAVGDQVKGFNALADAFVRGTKQGNALFGILETFDEIKNVFLGGYVSKEVLDISEEMRNLAIQADALNSILYDERGELERLDTAYRSTAIFQGIGTSTQSDFRIARDFNAASEAVAKTEKAIESVQEQMRALNKQETGKIVTTIKTKIEDELDNTLVNALFRLNKGTSLFPIQAAVTAMTDEIKKQFETNLRENFRSTSIIELMTEGMKTGAGIDPFGLAFGTGMGSFHAKLHGMVTDWGETIIDGVVKSSDEAVKIAADATAATVKSNHARIKVMVDELNKRQVDFARLNQQRMNEIQSRTDAWTSSFADSVLEATRTGKLSFTDMADSIIADMVRMSAYNAFRPLIGNLLTPLASAVTPPVSQAPTPPIYMEGEGGYLIRSTNLTSAQTSIVVNDMRTGGEAVHVEESQDASGMRIFEIYIRDQMQRNHNSGSMDTTMRQYGVSRTGFGR